jgi:hypothetical protein
VKTRPRAGATPKREKKFGETNDPWTFFPFLARRQRYGRPTLLERNRHVFKRSRLRPPLLEVGVRHGPIHIDVSLGRDPFEHDNPGGIAIRERPEQHGVNDAEDRGARADAQGEDRDNNAGEARCTLQNSEGVA